MCSESSDYKIFSTNTTTQNELLVLEIVFDKISTLKIVENLIKGSLVDFILM